MKSLKNYIYESIDQNVNEGLISWFKSFFMKAFKNNESLIKGNKVNMLKMDVNKLSLNKEVVPLSNLPKENLENYKNSKIGYQDTYFIIKNISKYTESSTNNIFIYQYTYAGDKQYDAGIIMYDGDPDNRKKENYCHILSIEYNKIVDNPTDVLGAMFNQFSIEIKKKKKSLEGFSICKNRLRKFGEVCRILKFKESEDSKDSTDNTNPIFIRTI